MGAGRHLYELDEDALRELEPDLIVTQAVCEVCAVSYDDVRAVADRLPGSPDVISLDPESLADVLADVPRLGEAAGAPEAAAALRSELESRLEAVRGATEGAERPRVAALEWLDPVFIGGHWIPEMIEIAGGVDPIGEAGAKSRTVTWEELRAARPEVVVAMPCGWDSGRAREEVLAHWDRIEELGRGGCTRWTRPPRSRGPGPAWSRGRSCWPICCTRIGWTAPQGVDFKEVQPTWA